MSSDRSSRDRSFRRRLSIPLVSLGLLVVLGLAPPPLSAGSPPEQSPPEEPAEPGSEQEATPEPGQAVATEPEVLATWKGGRLTRAELESWRTFLAGTDRAGEERPEPTGEEILDLVVWKSLARAAEARGLDATPQVRLRTELARRTLLVPVLRQRIVASVSVSDEEVESFRRAHPDAFQRPRKLKLRNLHRRFAGREPAEVRREMEAIHHKLLAGASFEELAMEWSESQTAPRGGLLGFVDPRELPQLVAEAVSGLSAGELSPPVEHGEGITLFLCEEVREAHRPTPEEVRAKIRQGMERQRSGEAWRNHQEDLLRSASPRIDPGSPAVVLELPGYRLGPSDLEALTDLLWPAKDVEPGPDQLARLLEEWASGVVMARRAIELGIGDEPEVAERLHWKEMEILARAELARRLEAELPTPTREQLRSLYEARRTRYREPAAYDLAVIDFGRVEDAAEGDERVREAKAVAQRIASGEVGFGEAARRHSKDPSAAHGGRLGWKARRQIALWGPAASRPIFALRPGETTPLLHLPSGLKIFALLDVREARTLPFEEVEDRVRTAWFQQQLPQLEASLRSRHLEEIGVSVGPAPETRPRTIRWSTASELESYGFDVYRGPSPEGPFTRINEETIPGAGTTDLPRSYEVEDHTADPGTTYYYYVEAISTSGGRRRLTPVHPSPARVSPSPE